MHIIWTEKQISVLYILCEPAAKKGKLGFFAHHKNYLYLGF